MIVCLNEDTYIDIVKGTIVEKPSKSIPFSSGVVFRKLKPSVKFKKRVDNIWISSSRFSLELLIAYYMLKTNKKRIVAFYKVEENKHIVMEFFTSVSPPGITSTWLTIKEDPQDYLEIEDKSFDEIFGNLSVSTTTIDFVKLQKEILGYFKPIYAIAAAVILLIIFSMLSVKLVKKEPLLKSVETKPPEQIALTEQEASVLYSIVLYEMVNSYNKIVSQMTNDKILDSASMNISKSDQTVTGTITIKYKSYYPYEGSIKESDYYTWTDNISIEKTKKDLKETTYRNSSECLFDVVENNWEVTKRDNRGWHIRYSSKDYKDFVKAINKILSCPLELNSLTMKETEKICELTLRI